MQAKFNRPTKIPNVINKFARNFRSENSTDITPEYAIYQELLLTGFERTKYTLSLKQASLKVQAVSSKFIFLHELAG